MSKLLDLKRVHHFILLTEELHFSRAADRANLSQTAFSRSIQSLEQDLDVCLFDRGTRHVEVTAAGLQLINHAKRLLDLAKNLQAEADDIVNAEGGELRFGASNMVTDRVLPRTLQELRRGSPKLKLYVEINHWQSLSTKLINEEIEFFVANANMLDGDTRFTLAPLPALATSVFCDPSHPLLQQTEPIRNDQLLDYSWASINFTKATVVQLRRIFLFASDVELPTYLNCNDLDLLRQMIFGSDALLMTWASWLAGDVQAGTLVDLMPYLPVEESRKALSKLDCSIVTLTGRSLSPAATRAIELIKKHSTMMV